jgi:RHS repeat-associated protein
LLTRAINTHFAPNKKIEYFYDAVGTKQKKKVTNGAVITTTDYAGNYIYQNDALQFISQPEGYLELDGQGGYDYTYQYKDHLGNIRLSYWDSEGDGNVNQSDIKEENNYYPFGLKHSGYNMLVFSANLALKYKYNGKELNDELGLDLYDYGARFYEPSLGRFSTIDPKAEEYFSWSPYNYCGNNPIRRVDVNGEGWRDVANMAKSYVARKITQAAYGVARAVVKTADNIVKDIVENTTIQVKGEVTISEELGLEINIKGVGGGGASVKTSEIKATSEYTLGLDGDFDSNLEVTTNNDLTVEVKGQVLGDGASVKYTQGADGTTSSEGGITTSTGLPGVQTESALKLGSNTTEVSTGVAIGIKTPLDVNNGKIQHISVDASLKIVYKKNHDEEL